MDPISSGAPPATCQVPLHVIAYSEDVQTPPSRGKLLADTVPKGTFSLLQGLGHGSLFGHQPGRVNSCIKEILVEYEGSD